MSAENPDFVPPEEKGLKITQPDAPQEVMDSLEKTEHIPTEKEVRGILQELIAGPYTVERKCSDGKGLYLLDVRVSGDEEGEAVEYSYMRKGRYPEGQASNTRIDIVYYQDGVPVGGDGPVAELDDGKWKVIA